MDVGAGGKGAVARAGQDDGAHVGIDLDPVQQRHQPVDQLVIQCVEFVGPVQRDKGDPVTDFEQH